MITSNVIQRVLHIRNPRRCITGTAFIVEHNDRSYIVTAKHVVRGVDDLIEVRHDGRWHLQQIRVIGVGEDEVDVAVLAYRNTTPIAAYGPVVFSRDGLAYSQTVYFLGYPYQPEAEGFSQPGTVPVVRI